MASSRHRLIARPLPDLSPDEAARFFAWIESLTPDRDREEGPGFAAWLRRHAATPGEAVWAFYDAAEGALCGTAALVRQDRELAAPEDGWVLGGVNVVRERRGQGIGTAILAWLESELTRRAKERGAPLSLVLQADNPAAIRLYERFGFRGVPGRPGVFARTIGAA